MQTIAKISLDLYNKNIVKVSAKQYDTGRGIEVTCTHNGIIYDVDTNIQVPLYDLRSQMVLMSLINVKL
mgnify:CR=1 FL=1